MTADTPDATLDWLAREAPGLPGVAEVLTGLSERLLADGIPLLRTWHGTMPLHPQVFARGWMWDRGATGEHDTIAHEQRADVPLEQWSPVHRIRDGELVVRTRLDGPEDPGYLLLRRMKEAGSTDYVIFNVRGRRLRAALSFATDAPGGFDDAQLARLERVTAYASLAFQPFHLDDLAATLLTTYLGEGPARRVLDGQIHRGDGVTLRAATWFCDLRGFTASTETLAMPALIARLNDWFEAMVKAVDEEGGEVLKFIGDGMLAAFTHPDPANACSAALRAARAAETHIGTANIGREDPLRFGLALHFGDVVYGNIGAPARLDFTVIGPAVNRASRLQNLTEGLGHTIIASSTFAALCGEPMVSLGRYSIKGVAEPEEVFAQATVAPEAPCPTSPSPSPC
ncbi:MAG: adenylate/guanylate cyclase domain-containing protein [Pseudomonadota bacterium]|nr:adenylate/guanylate cyclase domain-containing protein [Pseudomonadota bacterium]